MYRMEAEEKERKLCQFGSDSTGLERAGPGSGWNWFNEVQIWEKEAQTTLDKFIIQLKLFNVTALYNFTGYIVFSEILIHLSS